MSYYQDVVLKAAFYKEQIIRGLVKNGQKLNSSVIDSKLKEIDLYLSIYRETDVKPNKNFDVKKFNQDMFYVYSDLKILYKILFETSVTEFNALKSFANSYVNELTSRANDCKNKVDAKTSITALGNTLSVVTNKELTDADKESGVYKLNLGNISSKAGKKLALVIEGNNLVNADIVLKLTGYDGTVLSLDPYSINEDTITVPGDKDSTIYSAAQNKDEVSTGSILMSIKDFIANDTYSYSIYAGENKFLYTDDYGNTSYISYTNASEALLASKGNISFYIYNSNTDKKTSFYSSCKFPWSNFNQGDAEALSEKSFISFDCDYSTIVNFSTNGKIFAQKKDGTVINGKLYYPQKETELTDFYIVEEKPGEEKAYAAVLEIQPGLDNVVQAVKYAAIKELK